MRAPLTRPRLVVDADAVAHNVGVLRGPRSSPLMAVVKADGFGLGARTVAAAALAAGATRLGTATLDEAYEVVDLGAPVLAWLTTPDELAARRAGLASSPKVEVAVGSLE
ncbi:MAG: alanine racemase, partial [Nocardioides sp.]|uniref:alanine racemase n=1 Tax=Nocardioides sp. TaxID=35761 RepID=UPI003F0D8E81